MGNFLQMRLPNSWRISFFAVLLALVFPHPRLLVVADCFFEDLPLQEGLKRAPIVVRLLYNCPSAVVNLTCPIEAYNGENYVVAQEGYQSYTISEVFQQENWTEAEAPLQPGMSIAVLYDTDTGFWRDLPFQLIADPKGMLAFLSPYRTCVDTSGANHYDLPAGVGLVETPFLLNECSTLNQRWSDLSDENVTFLRSQPGFLNVSDDTTTTMTSSEGVINVSATANNNATSSETVGSESATDSEQHDPTSESSFPADMQLEGASSAKAVAGWTLQLLFVGVLVILSLPPLE
ncbi:expressed unknown protein [Seminavis robusta]|uniref:Uncharacterized protein n=1 Tax=Seminavis robusta TaxID=568900 RepID=A0A9N8EB64_9STRA|nr:expressed unknown protein [Seminavis robusta]|eukprot:Sro698_g189230.1 n/a (291) ;mRNA; r:28593-29465